MQFTRKGSLMLPSMPRAIHSLASGSGLNQLSGQARTYYRRIFLEEMNPRLVYNAFGLAGSIPLNEGRTISWPIMDALEEGETLTEGSDGTAGTLTLDALTATLADFGKYHTFSSHVELNAPDPVLTTLARRLARRAFRDLDKLTRDVLSASTNIIYSNATAGDANITAADTLSKAMIEAGVASMEAADMDPITGFLSPSGGTATVPGDPAYVLIAHAHVVSDLREEKEVNGFEEVSKYASGNTILPGEVGKIGNVRIVSCGSAGKIVADAGAGNVDVYHSHLIAADSYGVVDLAGRPVAFYAVPASTINQGNPLGRRGTIGYAGQHAAAILQDAGVVVFHSASSYGDNA